MALGVPPQPHADCRASSQEQKGMSPWPGAIPSAVGGDAGLSKLGNGPAGGAFPFGSSIYFGGVSGTPNSQAATLAVQDATPVGDLANVVLQLQIGEAFGYGFFNRVMPALSYNGGTQNLVATFSVVTDKVKTAPSLRRRVTRTSRFTSTLICCSGI